MDILISLINSYFPEPHASLLNGILLGRPLFVTNEFYDNLKSVGLIHIVVLSGMNITLLSAIVISTLVNFISRKYALFITIVIIILFVLFVGAEPPIIRAAIMGVLSMIGLIFGRKTSALYILFVSALVMILINHEWLTSISFQLSFSATLGIILFGSMEVSDVILSRNDSNDRRIQKENTWIPDQVQDDKQCHSRPRSGIQLKKSWIPDQVRDDLWKYFIEELRISLSAQVFTLPIIFWYFRQISFVSPLANILVSWLIVPIMILGMLTIVLGLINWHFGFVISWLVYPLLEFVVWVVETLSRIPFASIKL